MVTELAVISLSLLLSFFLVEVFRKFKQPEVLGQIFAGVILGLPFFVSFLGKNIISDIHFLSDMAIVFLLLLAGMEVKFKDIMKVGGEALVVAVFSAAVPFVLGFVVGKAMGYSSLASLVLGATLSITAEGTTLKVLMDLNALKTRVGEIILGAGIIDDVFEVIFLTVVVVASQKSFQKLLFFPLELLGFVAVVFFAYKVIPKFLTLVKKEHDRVSVFSSILLIGLVIATISQYLSLGPVIGAFIAGMLIQLSHRLKREETVVVEELKVMTFSFIIPFFFINIGLHLDFQSLATNLWLVLLVLFIATAGKVLGAMAATSFTNLSARQGYLIGWGMNARGAMELVIAEIARSAGLIPIELYSAIVVMATITTMIFPFYLKRVCTTHPEVLEKG